MRISLGTARREKKIINAQKELEIKLDKLLLEFADELVTITTFHNIERLFVESAENVINSKPTKNA